jgi:RimJ/RimL family protein N-acetyltransferase
MKEKAVVLIRPYQKDEFALACQIRNLKNDTSIDNFRKHFEKSGSWNDHFLTLAIESSGELVGDLQVRHCEYSMPPGVVDVGIEVAPEHQGKGIGSSALKKLVEILFQDGYHRISGSTAISNIAMQRAFENAGFLREGIAKDLFLDGNFGVDYVQYAITRTNL